MRAVLAAAIVAAFALTLSTVARAATITVNSLADTGAAGICVLRDAMTAANTMTITSACAAGTGNDAINFSVTGTIPLSSTLPQVTDRRLTIFGPAAPGITIDGGGAVQVMQVASGATLNLKNLTIAHGFSSQTNGGGIYNEGTLTVTNSTFSGNTITFPANNSGGGGIYNDGFLTVTDTIFSGNNVSNSGGGILNARTLTVTNSTFSDNGADTDGGGIATLNATPTIVTNSTFSSNSAGTAGGGVADSGPLAITNSTFSSNSAGTAGGGVADFGPLAITNSTFSSNSAGTVGGAIDGESFTIPLTVTNTTFSGNTSFIGGGISNIGMATITNSTFSSNGPSAVDASGALGPTSLKNSILTGSGHNCFGTITDAGYNISDDATCGFAKTGSANNGDGVNPLLSPAGLANNGGPTQTIALLAGSPAIDAIPVADCTDQASLPNPIITDQRLFPRRDAGETNCDIGAYEVQDTAFVPFSRFGGDLRIDPDAGVFYLSGGFKLGAGGSINPVTQPVMFSIGSYSVTLPPGSFVKYKTGYVYQKKVNGIFLCVYIKFTRTPGTYQLLANRFGGTLTTTASPVPVTLTVGNDSGTAQMKAKFD